MVQQDRSSIKNPSWGCLIGHIWKQVYLAERLGTRGGLFVSKVDITGNKTDQAKT